MVQRCDKVRDHVGSAERITPVYRTANFAYTNAPVVGDRFLAVGDAVAFVDPIFSSGVFIAMRTGRAGRRSRSRSAFADGRFAARRFARYERQVWRGVAPFFKFIHKYYEPAFLDLFLQAQERLRHGDRGPERALGRQRSSGTRCGSASRSRLLFGLARINTWVRRRRGLPVESRLEW